MKNHIFALSLSALIISGPVSGVFAAEIPKEKEFPVLRPDPSGNNWYAEKYNPYIDERLFAEHAQKKFVNLKKQVDQLKKKQKEWQKNKNKKEKDKEKLAEKDGEKPKPVKIPDQKILRDLDRELKKSVRNFKRLRGSSDPSNVKQARAEFEKTLDSFYGDFHKASEALLSKKEFFQWKTQEHLEDKNYQIKQLKKLAENSKGDFKANLDQRAADLEKKNTDIADKMKQADKEKKDGWKSAQEQIEKDMKDFDSTYSRSVWDVRRNTTVLPK